MKKRMNVIQIKGVRGIMLAAFVVCCLAAGFIVFPGWLCMGLWNYISEYFYSLPPIGLFQGVLLWAILVSSYFIFRKESVVVCMRTPQGLSEEELKSVFENAKRQAFEDPILQAMLKAREAELKYKAQQGANQEESESTTNADGTKV